jgi:glycosyltransferase involved in cell wall biosynthesis
MADDEPDAERPWLSVIVPSHNGERWLSIALQSLVDQKDRGIEVIVVDTSKTGASLRIVDDFSDRLEIRAYRRPDLLPWMAKTNFGAEQARADRICMLHQDDLWLPNRSRELRKWLSSRPDAVMHLHPCYIIDESGRRLGLWRCPLPAGDAPVPRRTLFHRLLVQSFIGIPTPTIRRDAFLSVGGMDNTLWQTADWDFYLKISKIGEVYYHSTPLACFRIHRDSLTVSESRTIQDYRKQLEIVLDRHTAVTASSRAL